MTFIVQAALNKPGEGSFTVMAPAQLASDRCAELKSSVPLPLTLDAFQRVPLGGATPSAFSVA